jgi:hypothetical protein
MPISLARARRALGPALELRIDPRSVVTYATGKLPGVRAARARFEAAPIPVPARLIDRALAVVERRHPFVLSDDRYPRTWPIAEDPKYLRLEDLLAHLDDPERTTWWSYALERIEADGSFRMKDGPVHDEGGLRRHLETYLLPLIAVFAQDGYRAELDPSPGGVHVGPDGALHKTNKGAHRFLLARHFGGEPVRVRVVCVHQRWWVSATDGPSEARRLSTAETALRDVQERHS